MFNVIDKNNILVLSFPNRLNLSFVWRVCVCTNTHTQTHNVILYFVYWPKRYTQGPQVTDCHSCNLLVASRLGVFDNLMATVFLA